MRRFLDEGNSNTFAQKKQLEKQNILADFEQLSNVVTFLAEDYECSEVLPILLYVTLLEIWFVFSEMARQQSHQRGWRRCEMISHAGLLSRPRQSEWICNRVTLTQHQSPVTQNSYLESRSPKELEVQDRFVRTAMTRKSRWKWHQRICLKRQSQGNLSLHTVRSLARLSNFLQMIWNDCPAFEILL